ncbi:hypothetical protein BDZ97DRAFT_1803446, partial [Flammula alnicola]
MAICQYFLRGQCRFGDTCRNEHPANAQQSGFGSAYTTLHRTPMLLNRLFCTQILLGLGKVVQAAVVQVLTLNLLYPLR